VAAAVLLTAACGAGAPTAPELRGAAGGDGRAVLFIGNSLTYVNDVPGIVQALADSAAGGGERLAVATVAFPDYALEDHWSNGAARAAIASRQWSVVVLQQGPSSLEESRTNLRTWVARFAPEIRKAGARPALYSVWPTASRQQDFDRATESYALAAADVDGMHFPAGEGWRAAWRLEPTAPLYAGDGLHASAAGSYEAALVIFAGLTGRSPIGLPARVRLADGTVIGVGDALAAALQRGAAEAIAQFGRK
jgi:hypothetical protein